MNKAFLFPIIYVGLALFTAFSSFFVVEVQASKIKTYTQWWPLRTTPWVYKKQFGGVQFMDYVSSRDFPRLKNEFEEMIKIHKPEILLVLFDWKDAQPLKDPWRFLPEGNNTLQTILNTDLSFSYFDDLIKLANTNSIKTILWFNVSAYGGTIPYPFSYYSKTGWFWKRPDWPYGLADPSTEAMSHPGSGQNGASYDWFEHEAGYVNKAPDGARHGGLTSNQIEDTGLGVWAVIERPNMVFNGFDTVLHNNTLHIHTPIPSYSSGAYRQITRDLFRKIGEHYQGKGIYAYNLFQEPTYAVLRENMRYCQFSNLSSGNYDGNPSVGSGNNCLYDVDYSQAELNRYNGWRVAKSLPTVNRIPYPTDATYEEFRGENLADFLNNLKQGLLEGDPNAKTAVSLYAFYDGNLGGIRITDDKFVGEWGDGTGVNPKKILTITRPDIVILEPPAGNKNILENPSLRNDLLNLIKKYTTSRIFISNYSKWTGDFLEKDQEITQAFTTAGFMDYFAPSLVDGIDPNGYANWTPKNCESCTFRYRNPAPTLLPGDLDWDSDVDIFDYNLLVTDFGKSGSPGFVPADIDADGDVDIFDYNILVENFGKTQ